MYWIAAVWKLYPIQKPHTTVLVLGENKNRKGMQHNKSRYYNLCQIKTLFRAILVPCAYESKLGSGTKINKNKTSR